MRSKRIAVAVGAGLVLAAVAKELRKPAVSRSWHGRLGGFVPYDLRPPTPARLKAAWWNPDEPRIMTDRVFGVGWSVNLGRVARLVQESVG